MLRALNYPPVWLLGFMGLAWAVAQVHSPFGVTLLMAGRALVGLGLAIAVWAAVGFWRARTTIVPHQPPNALVKSGPYRYSRNPIYLADLIILAGWSVSLGAPLALLLLVPFKRVLTREFIVPEERRLAETLGDAYRDYRAAVRRWL